MSTKKVSTYRRQIISTQGNGGRFNLSIWQLVQGRLYLYLTLFVTVIRKLKTCTEMSQGSDGDAQHGQNILRTENYVLLFKYPCLAFAHGNHENK